MRNPVLTAALYTDLCARNTKQAVVNTKDKIIENKAELARLGVTTVVVSVAARACGFRAGYKFAMNQTANAQ